MVSKIFSQVWSFFKEWEDNVCFASIDVFVAAVVVAVVVVVVVVLMQPGHSQWKYQKLVTQLIM